MKKFTFLVVISIIAFLSCAGSVAFSQNHIISTNDYRIVNILKDFEDGAKYYKVDYMAKFKEIKSIRLVSADRHFLGSVVAGEIRINEQLKQYPSLMRLIILRQIGSHYGLKDEKRIRLIMSTNYDMNPHSEFIAYRTGSTNAQERIYFEKLRNKYKLNNQL